MQTGPGLEVCDLASLLKLTHDIGGVGMDQKT